MVNLPTDMVVFFIYKMDIELLENNLDAHGTYAGMDLKNFISHLKKLVDEVKASDDNQLTPTMGIKPNNENVFFGFETFKNHRQIPITVETLVNDRNTVVSIQDDAGFVKTEDMRSRLSV